MTFAFTLSRVSGQWKYVLLALHHPLQFPLRVPFGCIHQKETVEKYMSHTQLHVTLEGPETVEHLPLSMYTKKRNPVI